MTINMADITMCQNEKCKKRENCYRFVAIPDTYQSYFMQTDEKNCKHFVQASKYDKERYRKYNEKVK